MLHATCHICNCNTTERHENFRCDYKLQQKQNNLNKIEAADAERAQCKYERGVCVGMCMCMCGSICVSVCAVNNSARQLQRDQAPKQPNRQIKSNSYIMRINRRGYIAHTPRWPQNAQLLTSRAQLDGHQYAHCAQRQQIVERSRTHISQFESPIACAYRRESIDFLSAALTLLIPRRIHTRAAAATTRI